MSLDNEEKLKQARSYLESAQSDEARTLLLEVLSVDKENQAALLMLGGEYFNSTKLSEAEMIFEQLVLLSPGTGEYSIALFNTLWKLGRHEEALEEIKRFMAIADQAQESDTIKQYADITLKISGEDKQDDY